MGGSAREWSTTIDSPLKPGAEYRLNLAMTKFGAPAVTVGYEIVLSAIP